MFRLVANANGFEAYRRVLLEYEPHEGARYAAMLVGVMKPKWSGRLQDFEDELRAWELAVQRYEEATRFPMPYEVKRSVVSMNAPRAIQSCLRLSDVDLLANYATLRGGIFKFLTRGRALGNEG